MAGKIKLVRQPPNSNLCGPAVVATICDMSLEDACELVGKCGLTNGRHLRTALIIRGHQCSHRLIKVCKKNPLPDDKLVIVNLKWPPSRRGHWVIRYRGKWYDPAAGVFRDQPRWWGDGVKITSFMVVEWTAPLSGTAENPD